MSKFSGSNATTKTTVSTGTGPLKTKTKSAVVPTHEGGTGYDKGDKTALFTLAVTNMVGEPTFYESANDRDQRFIKLVQKVTKSDPEWIAGFIPFLRDTCNMRSASVVVAVEAARVINDQIAAGKDVPVRVRSLISAACSRADEPAEVLGYHLAKYGRKIPMGIKRGIGDAAVRLYNERSVLKYDGGSRGVRMADVLDLAHPKTEATWQDDLFKHVLDRRHDNDSTIPESLKVINANKALRAIPEKDRRKALRQGGPELLSDAGYTWEQLGGWLPGGMDAEAWEAIIPSMGYMALLRNIRNFEQAGVNREVLRSVRDKLSDKDEVARSRQLPFRFLSAQKATESTFFASAFEDALEYSTANLPEFTGRTLVAIDTSGSMTSVLSARSQVQLWEVGALFAGSVAARSGGNVQVISYGTTWEDIPTDTSVLKTIANVRKRLGVVGWGTNTWPSIKAAIKKHGKFDRVIVFTDMQDHPSRSGLPADVPVYVWDLGGYGRANINTSEKGRHLLAGFSDASFKLVPLLETGDKADWPWLLPTDDEV